MNAPVLITRDTVTALVAHCVKEKQLGKEACGFVLAQRGSQVASALLPMRNTHPRPARFYSTDDDEIRGAYAMFDEEGLEPVAFFHSHLDSAPIMSSGTPESDLEKALDTTVAYLIVSLTGDTPKARAYRVERQFIGAPECHEVPIEFRRPDSGVDLPASPWVLAPGNELNITYRRARQPEPGRINATVVACARDTVSLRGPRRGGVKVPPALARERLQSMQVLHEASAAGQIRRQSALHARNLANALQSGDMALVPALVAALSAAFPPDLVIEVNE